MELVTLTAAFCLAFSFMLTSCASDQVTVRKSAQQYDNSAVQQARLTLPLPPRKLILQEQRSDVTSSTDKDIMLHKKLLESSSGNREAEKEEKVVDNIQAARKGTWREWIENPNKSEYFTMDYAWVRRRRPIHNKQIPFVP